MGPDPEDRKSPQTAGSARTASRVRHRQGRGREDDRRRRAGTCWPPSTARRTLACEIDAKGDLASFYETGPANFAGHDVLPGLRVMSMDTEASLREYLKLQLRIPVVGRIGPLAQAFDFVATAAPGVREILTVGKLCYEVRENHYDTIVVDATSTGHIVGQLAAPQAINQLVKVGLIRAPDRLDARHPLGSRDRPGLVIVTTPEEMPVNETIELVEAGARQRRPSILRQSS